MRLRFPTLLRRWKYAFWFIIFTFMVSWYLWRIIEITEDEFIEKKHMSEEQKRTDVHEYDGIIKYSTDRFTVHSGAVGNDNGSVGTSSDQTKEFQLLSHDILFWDTETETTLNKGSQLHSDRCSQFKYKLDRLQMLYLKNSSWNQCGRQGNAFGEFTEGGGGFCVRYRESHDYFVAGEFLSFHLAWLLGIRTVPCVQLGVTGNGSGRLVKWPEGVEKMNWKWGKPIAFIEWRDGLRGGLTLPTALAKASNSSRPLKAKRVQSLPLNERVLLAQWTDLILFDYLIGHHDRFARLQDDADKENEGDILGSVVPNLAIDKAGHLWFYDNEPGLLDAYALLYGSSPTNDALRFQHFHNQMLNTTCIFRKPTFRAIFTLYGATENDALGPFRNALSQSSRFRVDGHENWIERDVRWTLLRRYFRQRLASVIEHVKWCSN